MFPSQLFPPGLFPDELFPRTGGSPTPTPTPTSIYFSFNPFATVILSSPTLPTYPTTAIGVSSYSTAAGYVAAGAMAAGAAYQFQG